MRDSKRMNHCNAGRNQSTQIIDFLKSIILGADEGRVDGLGGGSRIHCKPLCAHKLSTNYHDI